MFDSDEITVHCDECEESVPISQSVLREGDMRICWMCYTDDVVGSADYDEFDDEDDGYDDYDYVADVWRY